MQSRVNLLLIAFAFASLEVCFINSEKLVRCFCR